MARAASRRSTGGPVGRNPVGLRRSLATPSLHARIPGPVAVIGSSGQLGSDLVQALRASGCNVIGLSHAELELGDPVSVHGALLALQPRIVINCAAYVDVDRAEDEAELAFRINALGALHVARACAELQARCVLMSTNYVFSGEKPQPYDEDDAPCPINVYGTSKWAGELLVRQTCPGESLIVRVASLFGKTGALREGGNFIERILHRAQLGERMEIVDDPVTSPTYTRDAAEGIMRLLERGVRGTVHVTNRGPCTWYELAKRTLELCHPDRQAQLNPCASFPSRAKRPRNSALAGERFRELVDESLPPWDDALKRYLEERGHLQPGGGAKR